MKLPILIRFKAYYTLYETSEYAASGVVTFTTEDNDTFLVLNVQSVQVPVDKTQKNFLTTDCYTVVTPDGSLAYMEVDDDLIANYLTVTPIP